MLTREVEGEDIVLNREPQYQKVNNFQILSMRKAKLIVSGRK